MAGLADGVPDGCGVSGLSPADRQRTPRGKLTATTAGRHPLVVCVWRASPKLFPVSPGWAGCGRHSAGHEDAGAVCGGAERAAVQHGGHGGVPGAAAGRQQHGGGGRGRRLPQVCPRCRARPRSAADLTTAWCHAAMMS